MEKSSSILKLLKLMARYELEGELYWTEDLEFFVLCNDTFHIACADTEDILEEDLPLLEECLEESSLYGIMLYCARKRNTKPLEKFRMNTNLFDNIGEIYPNSM